MPISATILSTLLLLAAAEASSVAKRDVPVDPSDIGPNPECCQSKMVGPYNYTRVSIGHVLDACISNCIYTRVGAPGSRFCFARGLKEVHCLNKGGIPPITNLTIAASGEQSSNGAAPTLTQTMTYSANKYKEKSFRIEVPQHMSGGKTLEPLTLVMHSCLDGRWQDCGGKDNMMFKKGGDCSITTMPSDFNPVDGALEMAKIKDTISDDDTKIVHSILLNVGEIEMSGLSQSIQDECPAESSPRRVRKVSLDPEQASNLTSGGVVFIQGASTRGCNVQTAVTKDLYNANCWYWTNPGTNGKVSLHNLIYGVEELSCCTDTLSGAGACCKTKYPELCNCKIITSKASFATCLDGPATIEVLLVVGGATAGTDPESHPSNYVQYYERDPLAPWTYHYVTSDVCNQDGLSQSSALGVGAAFTDATILFCEGYTKSDTKKCYKFNKEQGFQEWTQAAQPERLNDNGGHSVAFELSVSQGSQPLNVGLVWWIFPAVIGTLSGGDLSTDLILLNGNSATGPDVPEALNVVCVLAIQDIGVFMSGIPINSAAGGNKNWLYKNSETTWTLLPESKERRLGGSCGDFLLTTSTSTSTTTSTTIVMAGGHLGTTTSEKFDLTKWLLEGQTSVWEDGPDVGEARYGAKMVSMRKWDEIALVGGINLESKVVFDTIKVLSASRSDAWVNRGTLNHPVYDTTALAVLKPIIKDCHLPTPTPGPR